MSKEEYRKNRKAGKRGQGEYPDLVVGTEVTPPSTRRGLGLRKRRSATKVAVNMTKSWGVHRKAVAVRVAKVEAVSRAKALERRERQKAAPLVTQGSAANDR